MRTSRRTDERGMALAVAIFALVVVGALVAGAFYAGNLEQRTGRSAMYSAQAADAAEAGAAAVLGAWGADPAIAALPVNGSTVLAQTALGAHNAYQPTVFRLTDGMYMIRSQGTRTDAGGNVLAQRVVALLARTVTASVPIKAAVTVSKPIKFNGATFEVDGRDETPSTWGAEVTGCTTGPDLAGIRSDTLTGASGKDTTNIFGSPKLQANDPTVNSDFAALFGSTFEELKKLADITLPSSSPYNSVGPTLTAGIPQKCDVNNELNWGEPNHGAGQVIQCYNHFPVIYASGSQLKLSGGGRGQGILLIEGDFEIVGGFEFTGIIIAKGGIKINGNGNKITGALLAQDVAIDDQNSISGNTALQFSSCAVSKALSGAASVLPLRQRSWARVY